MGIYCVGLIQATDQWRGVNTDPSNHEDEGSNFLRKVGQH